MSDSAAGFAQFVPGFDFLQSLAKGASGMPQMPQMASWVAPTLNAEELDKRITELKAVQFWLEQNTRALAATIQALEVQKLTLATLQGMNVSLGEVANAFKFKAAEPSVAEQRAAERATSAPDEDKPAPATPPKAASRAKASKPAESASPMVDPMQLWGSLTQQFQQIAAAALKDVAKASAGLEADGKEAKAASPAKSPGKPSPAGGKAAGARAATAKAPAGAARKTTSRKSAN